MKDKPIEVTVTANTPEFSGRNVESKLSPYLQDFVRTPEFTDWFGDWQNNPESSDTSKIVDDETGEPQLFYHGTNRLFDISQPRQVDKNKQLSNFGLEHDYNGVYLTDTADFARQFADPIGADFGTFLKNITIKYEVKTYGEVFDVWNRMIESFKNHDDKNLRIEGEVDINQLNGSLEQGRINFSSGLMFDSKYIGWVGQMLQQFGGSFPDAQDELVPYHSMYPEVEELLDLQESNGAGRILIPKRAMPRIIPVFIKSSRPLILGAGENITHGVDEPFSKGFDILIAKPEEKYDSVIVDGSGTKFGVNIAVLEPSQLKEASV